MAQEHFHLGPPPGFRGLDPQLPIRMYQRHLPHWRQRGATYFVTFRLADSIPQRQLQALKRWREMWERENPEPRSEQQWQALAREITHKTEAWLDEGYGECQLAVPQHARQMADSLLHFQNERCFNSCYAVMPNHVHSIIKPLGEHQLERILYSIKRYVSTQINAATGRTGRLWGEEFYDRIIRDEEHLDRAIQYIGNNARKAGLPQSRWCRWIDPQWQQAGWDFRDP